MILDKSRAGEKSIFALFYLTVCQFRLQSIGLKKRLQEIMIAKEIKASRLAGGKIQV